MRPEVKFAGTGVRGGQSKSKPARDRVTFLLLLGPMSGVDITYVWLTSWGLLVPSSMASSWVSHCER
jgi:hypothetical protein